VGIWGYVGRIEIMKYNAGHTAVFEDLKPGVMLQVGLKQSHGVIEVLGVALPCQYGRKGWIKVISEDYLPPMGTFQFDVSVGQLHAVQFGQHSTFAYIRYADPLLYHRRWELLARYYASCQANGTSHVIGAMYEDPYAQEGQ
jgi:hypothetical protein